MGQNTLAPPGLDKGVFVSHKEQPRVGDLRRKRLDDTCYSQYFLDNNGNWQRKWDKPVVQNCNGNGIRLDEDTAPSEQKRLQTQTLFEQLLNVLLNASRKTSILGRVNTGSREGGLFPNVEVKCREFARKESGSREASITTMSKSANLNPEMKSAKKQKKKSSVYWSFISRGEKQGGKETWKVFRVPNLIKFSAAFNDRGSMVLAERC